MSESILDFYKRILNSLGVEVDDKGLASIKIGGVYRPLFVDKSPKANSEKRLCLPTREFLDDPDWTANCPFHPLSESIVKGESLIIKELKNLMNLRIAEVSTSLAMNLLEIAVEGKKLEPILVKEFLKLVPNVNEKTITNLSKILCGISMTGERRFSSIYIKRGGNIGELKYKRAAIVTFPFLEEVNKDEKEIFGVKLTNAEKSAITNLFNYILPNATNQNAYSFGSNSDYAPNFHAICGAYINIMKQLNKIVDSYKKHLDDYEGLRTNLDWEEDLDNMSVYYNLIPVLPYNDGDAAKSAPEQGVAASATSPTVVAPVIQPLPNVVPMQYGSTQAQTQPIEPTEEGKISWNSIVARNPMLATPSFNPAMPMQQQFTAPGSYAGYDRGVQVMPSYQSGGYQQQAPGYIQPAITGRV